MSMYDLGTQLEERGYFYQFDLDKGDMCDWYTARIYALVPTDKRRKKKVFYISDGGCSCSGFGEYIDTVEQAIGEMVELTSLKAARELVHEFYEVTDHEVDGIVNKFRELGLR